MHSGSFSNVNWDFSGFRTSTKAFQAALKDIWFSDQGRPLRPVNSMLTVQCRISIQPGAYPDTQVTFSLQKQVWKTRNPQNPEHRCSAAPVLSVVAARHPKAPTVLPWPRKEPVLPRGMQYFIILMGSFEPSSVSVQCITAPSSSLPNLPPAGSLHGLTLSSKSM